MEDAEMKEFLFSDEGVEILQDEEKLAQLMQEGKTFQEIVGFEDKTLWKFYEAAEQLYEAKRYDDAADAYLFVSTLNPYVPDFWIGLGTSQQMQGKFEDALASYTTAIEVFPTHIMPYMFAAKCCLETKDFDEAAKVFDGAIKFAKENQAEDWSKELFDQATEGLDYVRECK